MLRLTADDSALTSSADVTVTVNQAPVVNAGVDQTVPFPTAVALTGVATDDGLPTGSSLITSWTQFSGPGKATFADPTAASTTVTFDQPGVYVLQFTATDSLAATSDEMVVTVNQSPVVSAGANFLVNFPGAAPLNGTATDDGSPSAGHWL